MCWKGLCNTTFPWEPSQSYPIQPRDLPTISDWSEGRETGRLGWADYTSKQIVGCCAFVFGKTGFSIHWSRTQDIPPACTDYAS